MPALGLGLGLALANRVPVRKVTDLAIFGDSITAQNTDNNGTTVFYSPKGYATVAQILNGYAFNLVKKVSTAHVDGIDYDFGYGAYSASDLLNGKSGVFPMADIAAADPKDVFVFCGSNGVAGAATTDSILGIWDTFRAAGRRVFAAEILPRCLGASGYGAPELAATYANNVTLKAAAAARGIPFLEWASSVALSPGGYGDPQYMPDFVHPGQKGADVLGAQFAAFMAPYVGPSFVIPADGDSRWRTGNPYVAGNVSGIATGYTATGYTGSKVTDGDGTVWQRLNINSATTNEKIFRQTSGSGTFQNGDIVVPIVRVRGNSTDWGTIKNVQISLYRNEGAGIVRVSAGNYITNNSGIDASPASSPINGFIMGTPVNVTGSTTQLFTYFAVLGTAVGQFDIRQIGALKIN